MMKTKHVLMALAMGVVANVSFAGGTGSLLPAATAAMVTDSKVEVADKWDYIRFLPKTTYVARQKACFAFYPGAFVNPKAYAPYMRALAEQGYISFILKLPIGFALLETNAADDAKRDTYAKAHCTKFVAGGHSLGGVVATDYINSHPNDGLVLLASYPQDTTSIADQTNTVVSSIYGSRDCQTTLADIAASQDNLPPNTTYIEIPGGNHPQFGWYTDDTTGNCTATIAHTAQADIFINETLRVLGLYNY
jgi:hypothetical protein